MMITPDELQAQYERALAAWPFIPHYETEYELPRMLLFAIGSRETNLTNEIGESAPDGTRGHGVWQYEDGVHVIPPGFDANVQLQCQTAAQMLAGLIHETEPNLKEALAAYNCGLGNAQAGIRDHSNPDAYTTGGNYGGDVLWRMTTLEMGNPVALSDNDIARIWAYGIKNVHGIDVAVTKWLASAQEAATAANANATTNHDLLVAICKQLGISPPA